MTITRIDDRTIAVTGEIDSHSAAAMQGALVEISDTAETVLDLAGVTFVDSSGLRVIVSSHRRQEAGGGSLTLRSPSDSVRRLLDITGLTTELSIS
jgi:anti-anti-sigma factor